MDNSSDFNLLTAAFPQCFWPCPSLYSAYSNMYYHVIVVSQARGMYGIYCIEARGRKVDKQTAINKYYHVPCILPFCGMRTYEII